MKDLAIHFRFLQLYAHIAHNLCGRPTFFSDHEFLGGLYDTYEGIYDNLVERMIGLGQEINLFDIQNEAVQKLNQFKSGQTSKNADFFKVILQGEKDACKMIASIADSLTLGTNNLVAGIVDESEVRQYKMQQRLDAEV